MIVLLFSFSLFCAFVSSTFFQQARDAPNSRPLHVSPCKWMSLSPDFHLICSLNSIRYFLKGHFLERASLGDPSSIPGSGRSPGEVNGNPLQYSCLENSMDGEAWWATVHGVAKSQTWLSDWTELKIQVRYLWHIHSSEKSTKKKIKRHWTGIRGFPGGSNGKVSAHNAGDPGLISGSARFPGEGNGNPLQYSCLENSMDGEAWWATVHGVAKSRTRLSDFTFPVSCIFNCCFKFQDPKNN